MKTLLKASAKTVLPLPVFERIQATRNRRAQLEKLIKSGRLDHVKRHVENYGTVVQSGPFAGLVYPLDAALSRWCLPKLLGSYEMELHSIIQKVSSRRYDCAIDIGSAEGYYAAGLARLLRVPVYAYEPAPREKSYSSLMVARNGVSGLVTMSDLFTVCDMQKFSGRRALVLCDCEGFEENLFRPDTMNLTRKWDLIIELHHSADAILPALDWPHRTRIIEICQRLGSENEYRNPGQRFLWCDSIAEWEGAA